MKRILTLGLAICFLYSAIWASSQSSGLAFQKINGNYWESNSLRTIVVLKVWQIGKPLTTQTIKVPLDIWKQKGELRKYLYSVYSFDGKPIPTPTIFVFPSPTPTITETPSPI